MRQDNKIDRNSVAVVLVVDTLAILVAFWTTYEWLLVNGISEWASRSGTLTLLHSLLLFLLITAILAILFRKHAFVWLLLAVLAIYVGESVREYVLYLVIYVREEHWVTWKGISIRKAWVLTSGIWWIFLLALNVWVLLGPIGRRYFSVPVNGKTT